MQRWILVLAFGFVCGLSHSGFAQPPSVPLCVAQMQVSGAISNGVGAPLLMKFLNKQKPPVENVAIPQSAPEEALTAAQQKGCDYVVTTNQTELHSDSSWWGGGTAGVNMQTFYVTTAYKLSKVSDGSELSSGSFKASDKGSEQNAIGFTMKKIAEKVGEAIRKAGPVTK